MRTVNCDFEFFFFDFTRRPWISLFKAPKRIRRVSRKTAWWLGEIFDIWHFDQRNRFSGSGRIEVFENMLSGPLNFSLPTVFRSFAISLLARFSARLPWLKAWQGLAINRLRKTWSEIYSTDRASISASIFLLFTSSLSIKVARLDFLGLIPSNFEH